VLDALPFGYVEELVAGTVFACSGYVLIAETT